MLSNAEKKKENNLNITSLSIKVLFSVCGLMCVGLAWWMTSVWGNQTAQQVQLNTLETKFATLSEKVDGVDKKVDGVQEGVNRLISMMLNKKGD